MNMIESTQPRAWLPIGNLMLAIFFGGICVLCLFGFSIHPSPYFALLGAVLGIPAGLIGHRSFREACVRIPWHFSAIETRKFLFRAASSEKFKNYQRFALVIIGVVAIVKGSPDTSVNTFMTDTIWTMMAPVMLRMFAGGAAMFFVSGCLLLPDMSKLLGIVAVRKEAANQSTDRMAGTNAPEEGGDR